MILFYVILALLALFAGINWNKDRSTAALFLLLAGLWMALLLIFGVPPQGVVD